MHCVLQKILLTPLDSPACGVTALEKHSGRHVKVRSNLDLAEVEIPICPQTSHTKLLSDYFQPGNYSLLRSIPFTSGFACDISCLESSFAGTCDFSIFFSFIFFPPPLEAFFELIKNTLCFADTSCRAWPRGGTERSPTE